MGFTCHQVLRTKSGPLQVFKVYIAHTGLEHLVAFFWEGNCLSSIDPWPEKKSKLRRSQGGATSIGRVFLVGLLPIPPLRGSENWPKLADFLSSFSPSWAESTWKGIHFQRERFYHPKVPKNCPPFSGCNPPPKKKKNTHTHATLRSAHACVSFGRS